MSNLPTNYVDDVLNADVNTRRKYQMIQNNDGTVSFNDVTDYDTVGSSIGASQINAQNTQINQNSDDIEQINNNLTAEDDLTFRFATDGEGNHGYLKGDGTFSPFKQPLKGSFRYTRVGGSWADGYSYIDYDVSNFNNLKAVFTVDSYYQGTVSYVISDTGAGTTLASFGQASAWGTKTVNLDISSVNNIRVQMSANNGGNSIVCNYEIS